jgi:hypothetical protein
LIRAVVVESANFEQPSQVDQEGVVWLISVIGLDVLSAITLCIAVFSY